MLKKVIKIIKQPSIILLKLDKEKIIKLDDAKFLKYRFKYELGYDLDLDNPKTYNQKLQWLKLNDYKDIYSTMVDKYEAKKYVSKIIGNKYVIPTLGVYDKFDEIDFDELPNQFVIKCTHDSGGLIVVKDKKEFDINKAKEKIETCLKKQYYHLGREYPYKNVKPRVIIERYMEDKKYGELRDYKFFCFNGIPKVMFIATNRQGAGDTYFDFFDIDFNHLPFTQGHPNAPVLPDKPKNYNLMISLAKKISKNIPHVRVDFYEVDGKVYFGEITFYHYSGFTAFVPQEWDKKMGDLVDLSLVRNEK